MTSHTLYRNSHIWQHKLYLPSHPLYLTLHPLYLCHQTPCISCITPTLCMTLHTKRLTSLSVCMASHVHFLTSHPYRYDITSSIFMTSYEINMMSPIVFHENKMNIPDISPTVFDIIAPPSVRWHPLSQCLHNYYGSLHTWHTYDIIHTLHHIKFRLYDINRQHLGHPNTAFMTSDLVYMTSHPQFMTSHPLYMWNDSHYIGNITPTMFVNINYIWHEAHCVKTIQPLYMTSHSSYLCVITPTVSMVKYTFYLWHHFYCIYGSKCTVYDISPMIYDITTLYSWHQSYYISPHTNYIWEHIHCISVITPRLSIIQPPLYVW